RVRATSSLDLNQLTKTRRMAQGAEPLERIRSIISLLHDNPREDGESGPVNARDAALPSRDSLRRCVEQFSQGYGRQANCLPYELDGLTSVHPRPIELVRHGETEAP